MNINVFTCNACPLFVSVIDWHRELMSCGAMRCLDNFKEVDICDGSFDPFQDIHPACPFRNKDFSINIKLNDGV
jgi:hypothetical protein